VQEQIREALSLALRGQCELDAGDVPEARRLAAQAISKAPGRATRYLFVRALAEIDAKDLSAAAETIRAIELEQADASSEDESRRKAVRYLTGLIQLSRGESADAVSTLTQATQGPGKEYDLYQLGLARALLANGRSLEAAAVAANAAASRDPANLRIDLELSRREAMLLELQALTQAGDPTKADALRRTLNSMWANSDASFLPRAALTRFDVRS
jgi:tetratricopeptide (TPR) repeat protein